MTDLTERLRTGAENMDDDAAFQWFLKITDEAADQIERLTAELAHMQTMQKVDQRVFEKLTETRDLAEHWMIIAEQRRMELGECRKDAERLDWLIASGARVLQEDDGFYLFWHTSYRETQRQVSPRAAIDAAMEAKP